MPELPEVETVARLLRQGSTVASVPSLVGRTILQTRVLWAREISGMSKRTFVQRTRGYTVAAVGRHGKYLIIELHASVPAGANARSRERAYLLIHLRMSGRLEVAPQAEAFTTHARVVWLLNEGWALRFDDARKFGRVWLVDNPARVLDRIGPDALEISASDFMQRLKQKRGALKPLLLNQSFLAGVGNIYADESLNLARLHPQRLAQTLSEQDMERLHAAIRQVLEHGIASNGASFDWVYPGGNYQENFRVYGQTGQPCPNCGHSIRRIMVGQRSTHFCANCQKLENGS